VEKIMNDVWILALVAIVAGGMVWVYGYILAMLHRVLRPEDIYTPLGASLLAMIATLLGLVIILPWQAAAIPFIVGGTMCAGVATLSLTALWKLWTE
jgi:hypothetical protein